MEKIVGASIVAVCFISYKKYIIHMCIPLLKSSY
jgi:hypothetical protein